MDILCSCPIIYFQGKGEQLNVFGDPQANTVGNFGEPRGGCRQDVPNLPYSDTSVYNDDQMS